MPERELLRLKTWFSPVDESVWAELQETQNNLLLIARDAPRLSEQDQSLLQACQERLEMAIWCLERRARRVPAALEQHLFRRLREDLALGPRWPFTENNTLFWRLLHQVDEDLLLLMPVEQLAASAIKIRDQFDRNVQSPKVREHWLGEPGKKGPLLTTVEAFEEAASPGGAELAEAAVRKQRYILRGALHEVNHHVDRGFRQLAFNTLIRAFSGVMLFALLAYLWWQHGKLFALTYTTGIPAGLLLMGAAGAIGGNLISRSAFAVALGPTRRYFVYYLLARPVLGAFAALLLFIVVESDLLFSLVASPPSSQASGDLAPVVFFVRASAIPYARALLALVAGFSAERWFGTVVDRVFARMFKTADKGQNSPPSEEAGCEAG
ncbi:MAG TPA: hypothetical protein PK413_10605 [Thermoanaerobaculia bacterium]|nr:hypothetical protein [Thermoanaerobaculia bacterium]